MQVLFPRTYDDLDNYMRKKRVLLLYGPRRVGKTTLVKNYLASKDWQTLSVVGDDIRVRAVLSSQDSKLILDWASGYDAIFVDEAQRIPNIGWGLKILIDARPDICIIATGSSSFALAGMVGEPLTGRQVPLHLYPVAVQELKKQYNAHELRENIPKFLLYGMYPEVLQAESDRDRQFILNELVGSYLLKDILELERIKSAKILSDLLILLAFQIGNEVSLNELASKLSIDVKTVARYLDLFEKSFVLYNLRGFSRNLRKEVTRTSKYYFYDTGVRNALINNFASLESRNDIGQLWENFVVIEKLKSREYSGQSSTRDYFWRTWDQAEIDLIEDCGDGLRAYEIKYSDKKSPKVPGSFAETYPDHTYSIVSPKNFLKYL